MPFVYVLGSHLLPPDLLKVGFATKPEDRLASHRTSLPGAYYVDLWEHEQAEAIEVAMHGRLDRYQIHGEYFKVDISVIREVFAELAAVERVIPTYRRNRGRFGPKITKDSRPSSDIPWDCEHPHGCRHEALPGDVLCRMHRSADLEMSQARETASRDAAAARAARDTRKTQEAPQGARGWPVGPARTAIPSPYGGLENLSVGNRYNPLTGERF